MQGRGSGTHDELVTATYVGSELRQYGIEPAGDDGGYVQAAPTERRKLTAQPTLVLTPPAGSAAHATTWTCGKDFIAGNLTRVEFSGPLLKLDVQALGPAKKLQINPGSVVLLTGSWDKVRPALSSVMAAGAVAILVRSSRSPAEFETRGKEIPELPSRLQGTSGGDLNTLNLLGLSAESLQQAQDMPEGTSVQFSAPSTVDNSFTWNAVGVLRGTDPKLQHAAVLFSAHLDHLGIGAPVNGDKIYHGADDDASGTTAVLELARVLGAGPRPRRTVIFALFGSEELGGLGSTYFREHPPLPLKEIAANLEFEMIGRADPAVPADTVWLTGWERSNLGPTLAAHGARLVGDPHPDQRFFMRSDNYVLAKKGVVAQTISSYGMHADMHRPSDNLAHLDFRHMDAAIGSLLAPVQWLVNSNFAPSWNPGGQP
jgi:aminopeptidase YwaD